MRKSDIFISEMDARGTVDALQFARASIASDLRVARRVSGLTQAQLGRKVGKGASIVGEMERGERFPTVVYVRAVLAACGLPEDWKP